MIYLIDGNNIFMRNYFKLNKQLINGGTYGFIKSFFSEYMSKAELVVVCWDGGRSERRKELFPEYKAGRERDPEEYEDMIRQMSLCSDFLRVMGILNLRIKGVEADDVIAVLSKSLSKKKNIIIISTDTDFYQLLDNENINMFSPKLRRFIGDDDIPVDFEDYLLYKSVVGDTSDGIPGIKGIGKKRGVLLVEEVKNAVSGLTKGKFLTIFEENKDIVERNKKMIGFKYIPKSLRKEIKNSFKLALKDRKSALALRKRGKIFNMYCNGNGMPSLSIASNDSRYFEED